ncbi:hypothetical protein BJQ94_05270 [Cryobacterium sp. SO2]|uniref:hypothetical protein n=1 Tax=Cryobacterium sp. SO2 TaxID=1897060 RepID=UPI00223CCD9A|nr:hypothetical protein [Cryobacterium sp. SO2]WEO78447.1 hypothetical protein BJQ94_05270 [Cryobacterium sp. SO2]
MAQTPPLTPLARLLASREDRLRPCRLADHDRADRNGWVTLRVSTALGHRGYCGAAHEQEDLVERLL